MGRMRFMKGKKKHAINLGAGLKSTQENGAAHQGIGHIYFHTPHHITSNRVTISRTNIRYQPIYCFSLDISKRG